MHPDIVMMHLLQKGFMENYLCWYARGELFVCNESMVERMVGSTSSVSNMWRGWLDQLLVLATCGGVAQLQQLLSRWYSDQCPFTANAYDFFRHRA
jgi:hypothetical protein